MIWKVIEQESGHVCALAGADSLARPMPGERFIWQGEAVNNGDALRKAHVREPRFDPVNLVSFDHTPGLWQISSRLVWAER